MKTNKTLLSKKQQIQKMISLPAITLAPEEADRFIDYVIDESTMLKTVVRTVKMNKSTKNVRALGIGSERFLKPGSTFSSSDYLKTLSENNIELVSKKLRGAIAIFDDDLDDNIEADAFADHVMRMVANRIANELEEIGWISDTASLGGFAATDARSLFDGWRYRIRYSQVAADSYYNTVTTRGNLMTGLTETDWAATTSKSVGAIVKPTSSNADGFCYICTTAGTTDGSEPTWPAILGTSVTDGTVVWRCHASIPVLGGGIAVQNSSAPYNWEFKYGNMLKILPSKYKMGGLGNLRFVGSDQIEQDYTTALSARSTILGDAAIVGTAPLSYGKVPIASAPLMSTTMSAAGVHGAGVYSDCLLTPKNNLILGLQREIKIEPQRVAADEATYWFYSMRGDVAVENVNACVLLEKLTTA